MIMIKCLTLIPQEEQLSRTLLLKNASSCCAELKTFSISGPSSSSPSSSSSSSSSLLGKMSFGQGGEIIKVGVGWSSLKSIETVVGH